METNRQQQITFIPVTAINRSETNPRTIFDETAINELAESIKLQGVLQPILVRLQPKSDEQAWYELVAGERRWRAARKAGLDTIPAIVKQMTDEEALEIQVIENLQRKDLTALEEAAGYASMLALKNAQGEPVYTADSLAAKIGKSRSYVYARLKLNALPEVARKALADGIISASIGELIARVPNEASRAELCEELFDGIDTDWFTPPTFRSVKSLIENHFMRELKGSPFDQKDKKLLAGVPSCQACPKRTGNNRVEFPDGRADICTDPACYEQKVQAQKAKDLAKLAESGAKILEKQEVEELLGYGRLTTKGQAEYIDLDERHYTPTNWDADDEIEEEEENEFEDKTYGEILGDALPVVAVGTDRYGNTHRLVRREEAEQLLAEKGIQLEKDDDESTGNDDWSVRQAEQNKQKKLRTKALIEASIQAGEFFSSIVQVPDEATEKLRLLVERVFHGVAKYGQNSTNERLIELAKLYDVTEKKAYEIKNRSGEVVKDLDADDLISLMVQVLMVSDLASWAGCWYGYDEPVSPIAAAAGIDLDAIVERLAAEAAEAEKEPKAKSAKGKKAKAAEAIPTVEEVEAENAELVEQMYHDSGEEDTVENALIAALHHLQSAASRWRPLIERGATDSELKEEIASAFGIGGGSTSFGGYRHKGGRNPEFTYLGYTHQAGAQTYAGKKLIALVRQVMKIAEPAESIEPGNNIDTNQVADDFTAPQCDECGRIDGGHTDECSIGAPITLRIYTDFAKAMGIKSPAKAAKEMAASRERDAEVRQWMAEQSAEILARVAPKMVEGVRA